MNNLDKVSDKDLQDELKRRNKYVLPHMTCPTCNKYSMTHKHYQGSGDAWHCDGCNQRIENCRCCRI